MGTLRNQLFAVLLLSISLGCVISLKIDDSINCDEVGDRKFIKDPNSCNQFYYCGRDSGIAVGSLGVCPSGMLFNEAIGLCDLADKVVCSLAMTTKAPAILIDKQINCPSFNEIHFVPSETECRQYYICYYGQPILQTCAQELHWNSHKLKCDYPISAQCQIEGRNEWWFPEKCPIYGIHILPHTERCDYFRYCINGQMIVQQCPFYHHFDVESKSCKRRNLAICAIKKF